jgi:hypothetical protein
VGRGTGQRSIRYHADAAREKALAELVDAWDLVSGERDHAAPPTPVLVTLVGESGTGKTRLIREFYARIAADQDYWPREIAPAGADVLEERKAITPDYQATYKDEEVEPPFLWVGVDCSRSGERRHDADQAVRALSSRFPAKLDPDGPLKGIAGEVGGDTAEALGSEVLQTLSEAAGLAGEGVGLLGETLGIPLVSLVVRRGRAYWGYRRRAREEATGRLIDTGHDAVEELYVMLHTLSRAKWREHSSRQRLPIVLALEDAHDADEAIMGLLLRILLRPPKGRRFGKGLEYLPILVIATAWPTELQRQRRQLESQLLVASERGSASSASQSPEQLDDSFAGLLAAADESVADTEGPLPATAVLTLPDLDVEPMRLIVMDSFPHTVPETSERLALSAEGNPLLLRLILAGPHIPKSARRTGALPDNVRLDQLPKTVGAAFGELWSGLPEAVQDSVAIAALLGRRFHHGLAVLVAEDLHDDAALFGIELAPGEEVEEAPLRIAHRALVEAEDEHHWVRPQAAGADLKLFAEPYTFWLAEEHARSDLLPDEEQYASAIRRISALIDSLRETSDEDWMRLPYRERHTEETRSNDRLEILLAHLGLAERLPKLVHPLSAARSARQLRSITVFSDSLVHKWASNVGTEALNRAAECGDAPEALFAEIRNGWAGDGRRLDRNALLAAASTDDSRQAEVGLIEAHAEWDKWFIAREPPPLADLLVRAPDAWLDISARRLLWHGRDVRDELLRRSGPEREYPIRRAFRQVDADIADECRWLIGAAPKGEETDPFYIDLICELARRGNMEEATSLLRDRPAVADDVALSLYKRHPSLVPSWFEAAKGVIGEADPEDVVVARAGAALKANDPSAWQGVIEEAASSDEVLGLTLDLSLSDLRRHEHPLTETERDALSRWVALPGDEKTEFFRRLGVAERYQAAGELDQAFHRLRSLLDPEPEPSLHYGRVGPNLVRSTRRHLVRLAAPEFVSLGDAADALGRLRYVASRFDAESDAWGTGKAEALGQGARAVMRSALLEGDLALAREVLAFRPEGIQSWVWVVLGGDPADLALPAPVARWGYAWRAWLDFDFATAVGICINVAKTEARDGRGILLYQAVEFAVLAGQAEQARELLDSASVYRNERQNSSTRRLALALVAASEGAEEPLDDPIFKWDLARTWEEGWALAASALLAGDHDRALRTLSRKSATRAVHQPASWGRFLAREGEAFGEKATLHPEPGSPAYGGRDGRFTFIMVIYAWLVQPDFDRKFKEARERAATELPAVLPGP